MAYADYTYYLQTYVGNAIAESDWLRLSARASDVIDQLTFGRAADDTDNTTAIKKAMCAVADEMQAIENDGGTDGIASESIGSSSVSYADNSSRRLTKNQRYAEAAKTYLGNTGLMFQGFALDEYGSLYAD